MKELIKKYRGFIIVLTGILILYMLNREAGLNVFNLAFYQIKEMLVVIPPIFILLGLLDVWVPREMMMKYMGEGSGIKGIFLSFLIGSAAAGPLYGAFPVAAVFMRKGVKFSNVIIFLGAWSTTKIPMFLFEMSSLGVKFALTRLLIDIPGIIIIGFVLSKLISKEEQAVIYQTADQNTFS